MSQTQRKSRLGPVLVLLAIFVLGMGGAGLLMLARWSELESVSAEDAERAFAENLALAGERPAYVEVTAGGVVRVHRELDGSEPKDLNTLHVVAWEPEDMQLLTVAFPFWFVRMKMSEHFNLGTLLSGLRQDWSHLDLKITEEDLQRHGRGLVLDHRLEDGRRVLLWTE
jgi:hypothetical protein